MRRERAAGALALMASLALCGCSAPACDAPSPTSIAVTSTKSGIASVQCWSGCAPNARELEPADEGEWMALLGESRPTSVTLAARDESGGLLFA
ncbi:hypothetical protein LQ757_14325 [Agromyces sp. SYSU K20354]|uniref:hypothetical protein n=1 Tax=Agromyces cavernae TaxID=2898659 RepID=UPI001E2CA28C|nr:hypothetical protein [Agromyces cavernae]MCD2443454.1 hypothetical protein [Agromyces cavernae]